MRNFLEDEDKESDSETVQNTTTTFCDDEDISDCEEAEVVSCSEESTLGTDLHSSSSSSEEKKKLYKLLVFIGVKIDTSGLKIHLARDNIITQRPGLAGEAREKMNMTETESWQLLIPDDLIEIVCLHTNEKITEFTEKYSSQASHTDHVSLLEMKAFFGLLLLAGVFKSGNEDVDSL
ncbi:unnamed protein product [Parnassius apollo]|uniref:(apollo) hypothetical protein n=1 Tax=Parnassius apollo TaxID=110799 RepID=A0A8S3XI88_PARAO|nr:unnamed protein product [Parnassius apollo]